MAANDGTDLKLEFLIEDKVIDPPMGILSGYIQEEINQVSVIELFTVSNTEYSDENLLEEFLYKHVTVRLSSIIDGETFYSRYDGLIYEIDKPESIHLGPNVFLYKMTIRPQFWKLALSNNSKSYSNKSRIGTIDEVLEANELAKDITYEARYFKPEVYTELPQILQTEVSDLHFLQRLMSEAGINYYFESPEKLENNVKKKGAEWLRIVDNSAFFKSVYPNVITYKPGAGLTNERRISKLESLIRSIPSSVESTASFGEGSVQVYSNSESPVGGTGGTYRDFSTEGKTNDVARQNARVLKERFESYHMRYNGQSTHFVLRAGERFKVGGPYMREDKDILVTSVRHTISQTVNAALGEHGASTPSYSNSFVAVGKDTEVRPQTRQTNIDARAGIMRNQVLVDLVAKLNSAIESKLGVKLGLELNNNLDLDVSPDSGGSNCSLDIVTELIQSCNSFGVYLGKVTADTVVSEGEMTCQVASDHHAAITCKVGSNWLVPGGGLTLFPRSGMQVYFILLQGNPGEGVIVGYRPSSDVPGQDPAGSTSFRKLDPKGMPALGGEPPTIVSDSTFGVSNRQVLALHGEKGVAHVAVIDGDSAAVTLSANKKLYSHAGVDHHASSCGNYIHQVGGSVWEDIAGDLSVAVHGNNTEGVTGNQTLTVMGSQNEHINVNRTLTIGGENTVDVLGSWWKKHYSYSTEIKIGITMGLYASDENKATIGIFNEVKAAMSSSFVLGTNLSMSKTKDVSIKRDGWKLVVNKDKCDDITVDWKVKVGGKVDIKAKGEALIKASGKMKLKSKKDLELKSKADIKLKAKGFSSKTTKSAVHEANNVILKAKTRVFLEGKGSVGIKGGVVKIG